MSSMFFRSHLVILPIYLSSPINDKHLQYFNDFTYMRCCSCSLEIFTEETGREPLASINEQPCYISEVPSHEHGARAVGLKLDSPLYIPKHKLLIHGKEAAHQYNFRFRLTKLPEQEGCLPISLHDLFGQDPWMWQPTENLINATYGSLWATGSHSLVNLDVDKATVLYRLRIEYEFGRFDGSQYIRKWQQIPWDLRIHCWWTDNIPTSIELSAPINLMAGTLQTDTYELLKLPTIQLQKKRPSLKLVTNMTIDSTDISGHRSKRRRSTRLRKAEKRR